MLADLLRNEDCAEVDTHRPRSIVYFVLENRKSLLAAFDDMQRTLNRQQTFGGLDRFQAQALEMIASPAVRDAFDLTHKSRRRWHVIATKRASIRITLPSNTCTTGTASRS